MVLTALTNTPHSPGPCALKQVDFEGSPTPCKTNQITSVRQTGLGFASPYDSRFAWEMKKRHQGLPCKRHSHASGPAPILPPFRVQPNCRAGPGNCTATGQKMCRFDQVNVLVFRIISNCLIWSYKLVQDVTTPLLRLQYGIISALQILQS